MKFIVLSTLLTLIASCDPVYVSGKLQVKDSITLKSNDRRQSHKKYTLPRGTFNNTRATIKRNNIELEIINGRKTSKINLAGKINFPTQSGNFHIRSSSIKQNFSLKGNVNYQETRDNRVHRTEVSCTATVREHVCDINLCESTVCCLADVRKEGTEEVEYIKVHYTRNVTMNFIQDGVTKAIFVGTGRGSYQVYTDEEDSLYFNNDDDDDNCVPNDLWSW